MYLTALLFFITSAGLLTVSTTAYLFFYYNFIPPINLEKTVYLQYGLGKYPFSTTQLDNSALISQQPYDVEVVLQMPRTPRNLAAGNFMVDIQLLGPYNPLAKSEQAFTKLLGNITLPTTTGLSVLHHSRRPAMLRYESQVVSLAHTGLHLPLHVLGFQDIDTNILRIPMFDMLSFSRGSSNVPTHLRLEVQTDTSVSTGQAVGFMGAAISPATSSALQIYSSEVHFAARFRGLRYVIYNYRTLSFLAFTALFYTVSIVTLGLGWAGLSAFLSKPSSDQAVIKHEGGDVDPKIKQETEASDSGQGLSMSNVSDSAKQFPGRAGQPPIQFQGRNEQSQEAQPAPSQNIRPGEAADDEEGFDDDTNTFGRTTGRFDDSGIGTSMESGRDPPLVRRRSGRSGQSSSSIGEG